MKGREWRTLLGAKFTSECIFQKKSTIPNSALLTMDFNFLRSEKERRGNFGCFLDKLVIPVCSWRRVIAFFFALLGITMNESVISTNEKISAGFLMFSFNFNSEKWPPSIVFPLKNWDFFIVFVSFCVAARCNLK